MYMCTCYFVCLCYLACEYVCELLFPLLCVPGLYLWVSGLPLKTKSSLTFILTWPLTLCVGMGRWLCVYVCECCARSVIITSPWPPCVWQQNKASFSPLYLTDAELPTEHTFSFCVCVCVSAFMSPQQLRSTFTSNLILTLTSEQKLSFTI